MVEKKTGIHQAIMDFQRQCPTLRKKSDGYKYTYASLPQIVEEIRPIMEGCGLVLYQKPVSEGDFMGVETILTHVPSGQSEASKIMLSLHEAVKTGTIKNSVQAAGSIITYLRRYSLGSMLGIVVDDDADGNDPSRFVAKIDPPEEQINELRDLAKSLPEDAALLLAQAKVNDWALMDADKVAKSIVYLRQKEQASFNAPSPEAFTS